MCNRYYMELSPELRPYIEAANRSPVAVKFTQKTGHPMVTEGEVKPADTAPVIASSMNRTMAAYPMAFGFPSPSGSLILNARLETADQKPMFRESWMRRRCIIPASWYYEWEHFTRPDGRKKAGDKYMFRPAGLNVTWMAGLYIIKEDLPYFVILTREASGGIRMIHDRMPLILPVSTISKWIDPNTELSYINNLADSAVDNIVFEKCVNI